MNFLSDKRKRKIFIVTTSVVLAFAIIVGACAIYLGDYYRADNEEIGAFLPQGTTWKEKPDGTIVFEPEGATKGFIFYPGGKVEYTAYIPLMQACAEEGILCVLVEMHGIAKEGCQDEQQHHSATRTCKSAYKANEYTADDCLDQSAFRGAFFQLLPRFVNRF